MTRPRAPPLAPNQPAAGLRKACAGWTAGPFSTPGAVAAGGPYMRPAAGLNRRRRVSTLTLSAQGVAPAAGWGRDLMIWTVPSGIWRPAGIIGLAAPGGLAPRIGCT